MKHQINRVFLFMAWGAIGVAVFIGATETNLSASTHESGPVLLSSESRKASAPSIALGPDGSINVIWVEKLEAQAKIPAGHTHTHRIYTNLYFARSTDGGQTFAKPVQVNQTEGSVWGFGTSRPQIALGRSGIIHIFYSGNRATATADQDAADARYTRSTDGGRTFEPERTLNTVIDKDMSGVVGGGLTTAHCFGNMGVAPDGIHSGNRLPPSVALLSESKAVPGDILAIQQEVEGTPAVSSQHLRRCSLRGERPSSRNIFHLIQRSRFSQRTDAEISGPRLY